MYSAIDNEKNEDIAPGFVEMRNASYSWQEPISAEEASQIGPIRKSERLSFSETRFTLKNINLEARPGEFIVVLGE